MKYAKKISVQYIIELACSATRTNNNEYIKHTYNEHYLTGSIPNKLLMLHTIGKIEWVDGLPPRYLKVIDEDRLLATEIRKILTKKLSFKIISDIISDFETTVYALLNADMMSVSDVGFIAFLPTYYENEKTRSYIKNLTTNLDNAYLGELTQQLFDLDSDIIEICYSTKYDAWNVTAIIDNKMCSWMTKHKPVTGPAVIIKAKVKEHNLHWKFTNSTVTRLHYVTAIQ